uniref:phosphatidylinositol-3,4,5-trisphosphate 5-phosphatase n=1 Tax=Sphaeramia orbicularis TaxID=375764 RepID=A0A673B7A4_9TELE
MAGGGGGGGGGGGVSPLGPAPPMWYHRDLSRAAAEELLARAGRDGSFLVRDSEIKACMTQTCVCGLVLTDTTANTSQGVQPKRFKTLPELVSLYLQPSQGLVTTLLYPVDREETAVSDDRDYSDGEDEKPPLPPRSASTSTPPGPDTPTERYKVHYYIQGTSYKNDMCKESLFDGCKLIKLLIFVHFLFPQPQPLSKFTDLIFLWCFISNPSVCLSLSLSSSVRQLIKSQRVQNKLGIVFEKEKDKSQRKDFIFASAKKREAFCQLLQLMKNKHSNQDEPDMISIFIGTWNMGSVPSPKSVASWVLCRGLGKTLDEMTVTIPHDLYVFGTQENSVCDREWVETLRAMLKEQTELDYKPIAVQTLWNIKIAVLVKPEHENRISHVGMSSVKTGIANTLGNKGAVGVSFMFNGTSFGFVNCHLTSGNEKIARRNQNYLDILRLLSLGDKQLSSFDISLRFTHLFWLGDLNYRLDMDIQEILNYINRKEFEPLLKVDQLNLEREKNKVFLRFAEEEISFPPTYRYERGSRDTYVWQKQKATGMRTNVPSWCDRILWKSYPETHIVCNSYGCTDDIVTSDHSPVFATFEVGVTSQFVSKKGLPKSSEQAYIEFESIEAIVKTASRTKFFIEFYSTCLEEFKKSYENDSQSSDNVNFLRVGWSNKQLTTLKPLLSEIEYLQDQHLLLTVKSLDGYESYGECVLALKSMIGSTAQQFHTYLSHRGEETGNIRGSMRVRVPSERMGTRERLYGIVPYVTVTVALWGSSSSSLSVGESSVGEWLQRLGLERYEQGLLHNGWDDLEFLSDITEEDLEEAGVFDPAHKRILLESLRQQQQQK